MTAVTDALHPDTITTLSTSSRLAFQTTYSLSSAAEPQRDCSPRPTFVTLALRIMRPSLKAAFSVALRPSVRLSVGPVPPIFSQ